MIDGQKIKTRKDIEAIEKKGLAAFFPHQTPFAIIDATARRRSDAVAIRYVRSVDKSERDIIVTYSEFARRIRQAANLFRRLGLGPHDAVAILAPHVLASQIALWAAEVAGRVIPINPMLRPDHIIGLLRASGAKIAVVLGENDDLDIWSRLVPALRESGCLAHILHCDADRTPAGSDGCFEDLLSSESGDTLDYERAEDPHAIAAYFHTGGTTGAPKLALHTHRNQAFVSRSAAAMYDLEPTDILINGFPLFHVAGAFVYGLSVFSAGGTLLIPTRLGMRNRRFTDTIWKQIERYGATVIGGVPTLMSSLNAIPVDADISTLRMMLTGGSPLPTELADAFERNCRKPVRNILGMTECAGVVTIEPFHGPRTPGSTGLRLPFTDVRAFRPKGASVDFAAPCNPTEAGILALRGPNVSPGYSDAQRNAGTFENDGWLVSGDIGHIDADGRVFVTGRAKDVIIRGSHNIDPSIIEDALLQHPDVALAAAVGQPDSYAGELPVAYVTLRAEVRVAPETLRAFVTSLISEPAAQPKKVVILGEMPVTPVGKIYKPALRVLATQTAIKDALEKVGLGADHFGIAVTETESRIRLKDASRMDLVKTALTGMPIRIVIE